MSSHHNKKYGHSNQNSDASSSIAISRESSSKSSTKSLDVEEWLNRFKLSDYKHIFFSNNITIEYLLSLNNDELKSMAKHTLRMKQILHRKRFLDAVLNTKSLSLDHQNGHLSSNRSKSFTDESKQSLPTSTSDKNKSLMLNKIKAVNGGYKMHLFVDQNEAQKYQCCICNNVCFKAVELGCNDAQIEDENNGLFYCKLCLKQYLKNNDNEHKNVSIQSNKWMRKRISNLIMRCPAKKCEWNGPICSILHHLETECKCINDKNDKNEKLKTNKENRQMIESLMQKMDNQQKQFLILKEENKNLQSKLKKNTKETNEIKLENKALWSAIHRIEHKLGIKMNGLNDYKQVEEIEYVHIGICELYHPNECVFKKVHKFSSIVLMHSQQIKSKVFKRRYHSKIVENNVWTCCNQNKESEGCCVEETEILVYPCCGKKSDSDGCMEGYKCCGGSKDSIGCIQVSFYPCCKQSGKVKGCKKRYSCCKRSYPNSVGCKPKER